ncbi:MAG: NAD(P)-binding protein, partial [Flavobacteriales bacterium]|nr:NAD(P)-binding protein [Flavobacteriales bacterium]
MKKKVAIIGSGFSGLAASACLAKAGFDVKIFEKNNSTGGRARHFSEQGFVFDMGPSWYWMPDVFEDFFNRFGKQARDFYHLQRLDPSYRIFFGPNDDYLDVPAGITALEEMFEQLEPGSSPRLRRFLADGKFKYETGMRKFVHKPGHSMLEFAELGILKNAFRLQLF